MKKPENKIPQSKNAPKPRASQPPAESVELYVMQINDHMRAVGELTTKLYNEVVVRQNYINSLPKPAEAG